MDSEAVACRQRLMDHIEAVLLMEHTLVRHYLESILKDFTAANSKHWNLAYQVTEHKLAQGHQGQLLNSLVAVSLSLNNRHLKLKQSHESVCIQYFFLLRVNKVS
jgi:hypothetical protein